MDTTQVIAKKPQGKKLVNAERTVLIAKMVELLGQGYMSTYALAKQLNVSRITIDSYRPLVDNIIANTKIDRNVIRNLQLKRTYQIIEQLMDELKAKDSKGNSTLTIKEKTALYNSIYKFSSHLALITGLNVETHVNIDPTKLVIIRANKKHTEDRVIDQVPDAVGDLDSAPKSV